MSVVPLSHTGRVADDDEPSSGPRSSENDRPIPESRAKRTQRILAPGGQLIGEIGGYVQPVWRRVTSGEHRWPVTLAMATAIIDVAGLGFLGLGPQDPATPEWGTMLSDVNDYLQTAPWLAITPGVAIVLSVLGFNLIGDGLREALDPKLRGRTGRFRRRSVFWPGPVRRKAESGA